MMSLTGERFFSGSGVVVEEGIPTLPSGVMAIAAIPVILATLAGTRMNCMRDSNVVCGFMLAKENPAWLIPCGVKRSGT